MTVGELNSYIKDVIDNDMMLNNVYIKGEISNFKNHYSGHMYFTLKDEKSLIKCVMFKSYTGNLNFMPRDGMSVVVLGTVAVFERDGIYQIYVKGMEEDGMGALYTAYEKLKEKLQNEGLFDEKYKKKIPMLPKSIGVATSKTGAVIRDIINVTTRRFPNVNIKLYPVAVQGKGAAATIVKAIEYFNREKNVDLIIVARGGGSLEDLWPFNEEETARAIFASELPVISAVGHETDFTIADFVADLRAPTPSAAGELAVPQLDEVKWKLQSNQRRLSSSLRKKISDMRSKYESLRERKSLREPYGRIRQDELLLDNMVKRMQDKMKLCLKDNRMKLTERVAGLDKLSPLKTLSRGYGIIENAEGKIVRTVSSLTVGDKIKIVLQDGERKAEIIP
ncbi:MAG: exodeoxyribonuclease VII large subunit [Clostridia bacterium]|nr:exodeoxyribonuclease VII large subunit [Clostridia bacterium]